MRYSAIPMPERVVSISLDLEEDHAGLTDSLRYEALAILPEMVGWFEKNKIPLTIFVAGNFLEKEGRHLETLRSPEFHSHGYWHPPHAKMWNTDVRHRNIRDGLKAFESFFKRKSSGYRAACGVLKEEDFPLLAESGVKFDSSFFTGVHVSGVHLFRSARPRWYASLQFIEIPISAHPFFRVPISMAYRKLMGASLFSFPQRLGLGMRPLIFNFHLHDLAETSTMRNLSGFWRWIYRGQKAPQAMTDWILGVKDRGVEFVSMNQLHSRLLENAHELHA